MKPAISAFVLMVGLSAGTVLLADQNEQGQDGYRRRVAMPEPSAIPELVLFAGGIGILAWRRRKSVEAN